MLSTQVLTTIVLSLALSGPVAEAKINNPFARAHHGAATKKNVVPAAPAAIPRAPGVALEQPLGLEKIRRDATKHMEERENLYPGASKQSSKQKRKVRKRKTNGKGKRGCAVPTGSNVTSTASSSDYAPTSTSSSYDSASSSDSAESSSTTIIGNNQIGVGGSKGESSWSSSSASSSASSTSSSAAAATSSASSTNYNSPWTLTENWSGSTFFDNWNFWSYDDPTHGTVTYVDSTTAWNEGLISINSAGNAIMTVDQTQTVTGGRKSVRIHGNLVYTGGMVIMDAVHMPTGCGTWPAWWSNGPNWPTGGEIDILEGVNAFEQNQVSLHTGPGCTMGNMNQLGSLTTGSYDSYNCGSVATSNQGCGVRDTVNDDSYGTGFNGVNGGVYAMAWDAAGINVWWFPRSKIPADITAEQPLPSTWGTPVANFPSASCSPYEFFYEHFNIFDTTFCGDWAGADGVWNYAGYAGQDQSCAAMTGYSTCSDYVLNNGNKFSEAYWEISYVKYFNSTTEL